MPGFCIYQDSKYARILNIPVLWIFEGCQILQFQICQGSEYTTFTLASECTWISLDKSWICLIMSHYARMLKTSLILSRVVSLRSQFVIFENSAKINLHYYHKTLYQRFFTDLWIHLRSWRWTCSGFAFSFKYVRGFHMHCRDYGLLVDFF